jgi:hypothetical protein
MQAVAFFTDLSLRWQYARYLDIVRPADENSPYAACIDSTSLSWNSISWPLHDGSMQSDCGAIQALDGLPFYEIYSLLKP